MKQAGDEYTLDLLGNKKRGRPRKPDALTPAERARAYRARQREQADQPAHLVAAKPNIQRLRRLAMHASETTGLDLNDCYRVINALWQDLPTRKRGAFHGA